MQKKYINDLDLLITKPDGVVNTPTHLASSFPSSTLTSQMELFYYTLLLHPRSSFICLFLRLLF